MKITLMLLLVALLAMACKVSTNPNDDKPIPVEPDGGIGTTPPGDKPIPTEPDGGIGTTNPYVRFISSDPESCKTIMVQCIEGASSFNNASGCGCKADDPKKYISNDTEECSRIRFMCIKNYVPFTDAQGCGCEFDFGEDLTPADGKLKAIDCTPEQRKAEVCTQEYAPVCGWNDPAKIQCIRYPCASTYSNACNACQEPNVLYYTQGECPSGNSAKV